MVEKSPDYVFLSDFHVVKPLGLGVVGVSVIKFALRKKVTSSNSFLLLYLIFIIFYLLAIPYTQDMYRTIKSCIIYRITHYVASIFYCFNTSIINITVS